MSDLEDRVSNLERLEDRVSNLERMLRNVERQSETEDD